VSDVVTQYMVESVHGGRSDDELLLFKDKLHHILPLAEQVLEDLF